MLNSEFIHYDEVFPFWRGGKWDPVSWKEFLNFWLQFFMAVHTPTLLMHWEGTKNRITLQASASLWQTANQGCS